MSNSRIARARVVQGCDAGAATAVTWPAIGEPLVPLAAGEANTDASGASASGASASGATRDLPPEPPALDCSEQIAAMRREMEAHADFVRLSAHAEGVREGEQRGRQLAAAEVEPVMARLLRTIADLSATRDSFRREAEEDIVRLALGIARRVVHREVSVDSTVLLGVIRAALDKLEARESHRILVAAADQPAIRAGLDSMRLNRRFDVIADPSLERGAVLFETVKGSLDASLETQLDEIERGLVDALDRRAS